MYAGGQGATGSATSELVRVSAFRISNCKTIFEEASVRFIHTSDWHLGRSFHRQDLLATQAQFLNWLLALAKKEAVGAVLVAGDVYDRSQPPADAVKLLDSTVSDFAQARIPLIITAGNHDSPVRLQYGKNLFADQGIHIRANLESVTEPVILTDDHGQVGVYGIPYLHPDLVNEELGSARSHESVLARWPNGSRRMSKGVDSSAQLCWPTPSSQEVKPRSLRWISGLVVWITHRRESSMDSATSR
jgi:hypothetical protein